MDRGNDTLFEMTLGAIAQNGFHTHMIVANVFLGKRQDNRGPLVVFRKVPSLFMFFMYTSSKLWNLPYF